jgi:hypothetical protein
MLGIVAVAAFLSPFCPGLALIYLLCIPFWIAQDLSPHARADRDFQKRNAGWLAARHP